MNKAAVTSTVVGDHLVAIHREGKRRDKSCCSRLIVPGKSSAKAPRDHSMTPDNDSLNRKRQKALYKNRTIHHLPHKMAKTLRLLWSLADFHATLSSYFPSYSITVESNWKCWLQHKGKPFTLKENIVRTLSSLLD